MVKPHHCVPSFKIAESQVRFFTFSPGLNPFPDSIPSTTSTCEFTQFEKRTTDFLTLVTRAHVASFKIVCLCGTVDVFVAGHY